MPKIFVVGHPSHYGGAGSELYHQILLWRKVMNLDVTIIPSHPGFQNEPLREEMLEIGVEYTASHRDYSTVTPDDLVMNFCGKEFLQDLRKINEKTKRTAFINCMTYLFNNEKLAHEKGLIRFSLYQRQGVLDSHEEELVAKHKSKAEFILFKPYFHIGVSPTEDKRLENKFTIGRISRQDTDKFSANTFHIWEYAVAPVMKRGIVLGFDKRSEEKTGTPPNWVKTYVDQNQLSVRDFYASCDVIVQSTDTTENLPRIGFEAMYAGVPLIVDDRGGWQHMIEHKKTGFLCKTPQEFIYWTSRMAFESGYRSQIAMAAKNRAVEMSGEQTTKASWDSFFKIAFA